MSRGRPAFGQITLHAYNIEESKSRWFSLLIIIQVSRSFLYKQPTNTASDEKNLQEEEEDSEEHEIEVNVPTISKALQAVRVVHIFLGATSENVVNL